MTDLKSQTLTELQKEMEQLGEKKFRAKQLYSWMHEKLVDDFDQMTNLPKGLLTRLKENYTLTRLVPLEVQVSKQDGTAKFLFQLPDGNVIESVLMRYHHGNSVCISSQVGCRMGCRFCASTLGGLTRGLTPSEMLEQIYQIQKWSKERVHNVVVMGTGEPLDNYETLLRFIELLSTEGGLHISQRNITVSTCGIVPKIKELAKENLQITLALSLHAPTQEKRKSLMPIASRYELSEVIEACCYYFNKTKRRITFEYSLVGGINDTREDAKELIRLLKPLNCHVNLIPVNPIKERDYVESKHQTVINFKNYLEKSGIHVTIRRELGRDIDGACGQRRKSYMDREKER